MSEELDRLRAEIEDIDAELIALLAKRFRRIEELARVKAAHRLPVEDAEREARLRELHARWAKRQGIDPAVALRVFAAILAESKRVQGRSSKRTG